jgi:hypothetical protein
MELGNVGLGGMDCIDLAQAGDHWRAIVYMVMNPRIL